MATLGLSSASNNNKTKEDDMFALRTHWALLATCLTVPVLAIAGQSAPVNLYLAQSYNNQTHWNDGASDSTDIAVPRGIYKMTPDAYRILPNESASLVQYTDKVGDTDLYWFWAGFSLRKVKIEDDFKFTEVARVDLPTNACSKPPKPASSLRPRMKRVCSTT